MRAQKALGYELEVAIIQELSHLPYFFCWSHVYVVSGDWSLQGHWPLPDPGGEGEDPGDDEGEDPGDPLGDEEDGPLPL